MKGQKLIIIKKLNENVPKVVFLLRSSGQIPCMLQVTKIFSKKILLFSVTNELNWFKLLKVTWLINVFIDYLLIDLINY